jgi:phosphoglycolate phosphatase/putative hydrolase of the HAD superfamily
MKVYRIPPNPRALIFDMDLTLYSSPEYGKAQVDNLIALFGKKQGKAFSAVNRDIEEARKALALAQGGKEPGLSGVLLSLGVTMEENIRWREAACEPEKYLGPDSRLRETLKELSRFFALGVVTNNPALVAERTLACLGVADCFGAAAGLDTCMVPKPHRLPFERMAEALNVPPESCISIGDRYDIDIALPLEMGMGGILVDGVGDVYCLPRIVGAG